jgi:hypothetical protein
MENLTGRRFHDMQENLESGILETPLESENPVNHQLKP